MNKKRIAVYCRVSTTDQNPENQKIELEKYAQAMGWNYEVFEEKESTRKTRPIKNKLYQEAIKKQWDGILVWKLDRWARSLQELINDLEILRNNGIIFQSYKDNITLDNSPTNNLMIHILASFAQFERDIISERTKAGLARTKSNGTKLGRPKNSKDKKRRKRSRYLLRWQKTKK